MLFVWQPPPHGDVGRRVEEEMGRRALAPATRAAYGRVARGYLVFLEQRGISDLGRADGASVLVDLLATGRQDMPCREEGTVSARVVS
jgi:hypothetical protein